MLSPNKLSAAHTHGQIKSARKAVHQNQCDKLSRIELPDPPPRLPSSRLRSISHGLQPSSLSDFDQLQSKKGGSSVTADNAVSQLPSDVTLNTPLTARNDLVNDESLRRITRSQSMLSNASHNSSLRNFDQAQSDRHERSATVEVTDKAPRRNSHNRFSSPRVDLAEIQIPRRSSRNRSISQGPQKAPSLSNLGQPQSNDRESSATTVNHPPRRRSRNLSSSLTPQVVISSSGVQSKKDAANKKEPERPTYSQPPPIQLKFKYSN